MLHKVRPNTKHIITSFTSFEKRDGIWRTFGWEKSSFSSDTLCLSSGAWHVTWFDPRLTKEILFYLQRHLVWSHSDRCVFVYAALSWQKPEMSNFKQQSVSGTATGCHGELQTLSGGRINSSGALSVFQTQQDRQLCRPANGHDRSQTDLHRVCIPLSNQNRSARRFFF